MQKIFEKLEYWINIVIYSSVVYLLGSTYYTNKFKLILSLIIIAFYFYKIISKEKINLIARTYVFPAGLISLFLYGLLMSNVYISSNDLTTKEIEWIYNRSILMFMNFIFAIAIYFYAINKTYQQLINIIFFIAGINCIVGILQLLFPELSRSVSGRLSLLSMEPNHAALHFMFVFWLVYYNKSSIPVLNFVGKLFLIVGLFIRSKVQLMALIITSTINNLKSLVVVFFVLLLLFNFSNFFESREVKNETTYCAPSTICDQMYWLSEDFNRFSNFLMKGNKTSVELKPSYYTRFFSFYYSLDSIAKNSSGIGWGGFNTYFQNEIENSNLKVKIIGDSAEYSQILSGIQESTPKSNLLEVLVSTGWLGIVLFLYLNVYFYKHRKKNKSVYLTFISILVSGFWVETAPFLAILAMTYVLLLKSTEE